MLFGSCHLILSAQPLTYFQIVRRQCCLVYILVLVFVIFLHEYPIPSWPVHCSPQEGEKLDGLLVSSDKLEGFLTSVDKKRANKKKFPPSKEMRSNYLFSVKHRAELVDEVNERVPFLGGGANTGRFNGEVPYRIQEMWKHRGEKKGGGKMPRCHDRKVHRHQLTLASVLRGGSYEICRTGEYLRTIILRWSIISNDAHLQYILSKALLISAENSPPSEIRGTSNESERYSTRNIALLKVFVCIFYRFFHPFPYRHRRPIATVCQTWWSWGEGMENENQLHMT